MLSFPIIFFLHCIRKKAMLAYTFMVNNIVRSKYNFAEKNKTEKLYSKYIFGLIFQSPPSK